MCKSHLVVKGYTELEGVSYFNTFLPVTKLTTVRTLLALASIKQWNLEQLDVNNSFLHGDLNEKDYMTIPQGCNVYHYLPQHRFVKLIKVFMGLNRPADSGILNYLNLFNLSWLCSFEEA